MKFIALLASLVLAAPAAAATIEEDVQRFIEVMKGNPAQHAVQLEALHWMGISDERIYDLVEKSLLSEYASARGNADLKRLSWYLRALGFSGQDKYLPTLDKLAAERSFDRYAKAGLKDSPKFRTWNPVISDRSSFDPALSDDLNRIANMVRGADIELKGVGARRIVDSRAAPKVSETLLDQIAADAKANYLAEDWTTADAVGWMVKCLGSSKKEKYRPFLEEVSARATRYDLRGHAVNAIKYSLDSTR